MAKRARVVLIDDIDGSEATQTIQFSFEGVSYEIDLNDENAQQMRADLSRYTDVAQRLRGRSRTSSAPKYSKEKLAAVRKWATTEKGYKVSSRGRVAQAIIDEYDAVHNG